MRTKVKLFVFAVPLFLIAFSNAWGASGTIVITSPDPGQVFKTTSSFSVFGTAVLNEDSTPNTGGYWYYYWDWIWAFPLYAKVMWRLDDNKVTYRNELRYISRVGEEYNFAVHNVNISDLDPAVTHTVTIYFQDIYGRGNPPSLGSYQGNAIGHETLTFKIVKPCDLKINSFTGSRALIDPSKGENVVFSGSMTETSGAHVQWSIKITDSSGAQWRTYSGTGKSPSISWDGKDSYGRIVDDGSYTATLEARTEDGKCKKTAGVQVTVKSSCNVSMSISSTSVWPDLIGQYPGAGSTDAEVTITQQNPAPFTGCTIALNVTAVENSGGHVHTGSRPKGSVSPSTISFAKGEQGPKTATYTSSEVSGKEKIKGILAQTGQTIGEKTMYISVTGLTSLGEGSYNLKCSIQSCFDYKHADFYNVQPWVAPLFGTIAEKYHESFPNSEELVVTDASLWRGGLYDKDDTWSPPHRTHRIGTDIDVRSWNISKGKQRVLFESIVCANSGIPLLETSGIEHYHVFFIPYRNTKGLCEKEMSI